MKARRSKLVATIITIPFLGVFLAGAANASPGTIRWCVTPGH